MRKSLLAILLGVLASAWTVGALPQSVDIIKNGFGPIFFLRYSPDGRELARVCALGPPMLFETGAYAKARTFPIELRMVAYSLDGRFIVTAEGTDGARVWDAHAAGKPMMAGVPEAPMVIETPLHVLQEPSKDSSLRVFRAEFSPDGRRLITAHANGHVKVWDTRSWVVDSDVALGTAELRAAAIAPDSKSMFVADTAGVLHQWSFETKAETHAERTNLGPIMDVVLSPDGARLITVHADKRAALWETKTWTSVVKDGVQSAAFPGDGAVLALGGGRVDLLDGKGSITAPPTRTIELPMLTMREALGERVAAASSKLTDPDRKLPIGVAALAFSPDGRTLAAGCQDGTVRLLAMKTAPGL